MPKSKKGGSSRKVGRTRRSPMRGERRFKRAYENKLRRVNRDRAKSGRGPLYALPDYNLSTGVPEGR